MKIFTQQVRALLFAAVVVVIGAVWLSGCGGGGKPSELVGRWIKGNGNGSMELFKDGTGVSDGEPVTWKVENKRFVIQTSEQGMVADYKVFGYELVLISDDKDSVTYVKKEKFEEYKKKKEEEEKKEAERLKEEQRKEAERLMKEEEQRLEKLSSYFTDSRNGLKYRAVKISGKTWMAENMNYQTGNSWCYNNDESNCKKYGRLYDWNTAKTVCPSGWHLPSREEWGQLAKTVGGTGDYGKEGTAGTKLKSVYGWDNGNGSDDYGFSALPGGNRNDYDGKFYHADNYGYWWTATGSGIAYYRFMSSNYGTVDENYSKESGGFSVRCVAD